MFLLSGCRVALLLGLLCTDVSPVGANFLGDVLRDLLVAKHEQVPASKDLVVIGAGFARTGTASLYTALQILGFRTYHMREVPVKDHSGAWQSALRQKSVQEAEGILLGNGYNATVDTPGALFAVQLAERFPQARVILTTRADASKWLGSVRSID